MPHVYRGIDPAAIENRPLEEHELNLMQRIMDEGGRVRLPIADFRSMKPAQVAAIKAMIDTLRELETRGLLEAEPDDARSEVRVTLLTPGVTLLLARNCLKKDPENDT